MSRRRLGEWLSPKATVLERRLMLALGCLMLIGIGFVVVETALRNMPSTTTLAVSMVGIAVALALVLRLNAGSRGSRSAPRDDLGDVAEDMGVAERDGRAED